MHKGQSAAFSPTENTQETLLVEMKKHQKTEFILLNEFYDKDIKRPDRKSSNKNFASLGSLNNKFTSKAVVTVNKHFFSYSQKKEKSQKEQNWTDRFSHDGCMSIVSLNKKRLPPISTKDQFSYSNDISSPDTMHSLLTPSLKSTPKPENPQIDLRKHLSLPLIKEINMKVDEYHIDSLSKTPNFTPSSIILEITEARPEKSFRFQSNSSPDKKLKTRPTEKKEKNEVLPELLHSGKLKSVVPLLNRIFFHPNKFFQHFKLIIINLSGHSLIDHPKTLQLLKKLCSFAHLVFVVKDNTENVLKICENADIWVSGVYLINYYGELAKYCKRCLSYSQIFLDFKCKKLEKNCVIVTTHCLAEGESTEDCLALSNGLLPKVCINQAPIPCFEYPEMPLTFILPSFDSSSFLLRLLVYLDQEFTAHPATNFLKVFESAVFTVRQCSFYAVILHNLKINWKKFSKASASKVVYFTQ